MRRHIFISICAMVMALLMPGKVIGQDNKPALKIAVYATGNVSEGHKSYIANAVEHALISTGNLQVLPRQGAVIEQLIKERQYQRTGNVTDADISKLGVELGADLVCVVEVIEFLGLEINARTIKVAENRAVRSARSDLVNDMNNKDQMRKAAEDIVNQLVGGGSGRRPAVGNSGVNRNNTQRHPAEPEMVAVDGGTFWMGCSSEQQGCNSDESPLHSVTISSFQMAKYEVTQAQWKLIMGNNPSNFKGDNLPVETVSWNDAQEFISRLNAATGKHYRLPTEAEWEYAARGGNKTQNYTYSGSHDLNNVGWFTGTTHPVGTKLPNELGIYDMSGNVREWCSDWYGTYPASAQHDPMGASSGSYRVNRGGDWHNLATSCRVADRRCNSPGFRSNYLGFRLVLP